MKKIDLHMHVMTTWNVPKIGKLNLSSPKKMIAHMEELGIEKAVLKATLIAMLDILPILGTGGIMIPWAVISFVLGYTTLGIRLLIIYIIVTVVRNYVEPKIVGTQLGLHPIITLVSMFIGLRLFGFWGLFGLPVGISFLWKQKKEKDPSGSSDS